MRANLLKMMESNISEGNDCRSCTAPCCTFVHNSMRIDEAEAKTIVDFLNTLAPPVQKEVRAGLRKTASDYALERVTPLRGSGDQVLRKTYTCTFLGEAPLGCTLPFSHKPLGCIAFNPLAPAQREGGECGHLLSPDAYLNPAVPRKPIPIAVLEAWREQGD